jgi:hypothetical protein
MSLHYSLVSVHGPSLLLFEPLKISNLDFNADPDPGFHSNADPVSQNNADPDLEPWYQVAKFGIFYSDITL